MILQALYQLAEDEELAEDLDFEMVPIGYGISLAGGSATLIPRFDPPANAKGKPRPAMMKVPRRRPGLTSGNDPHHLLVEKAEYVFGWDPSGKRDSSKLEARIVNFRADIELAYRAQTTGSDEGRALEAVLAFLDLGIQERIAILLSHLGPEPPDSAKKEMAGALFAFQVSSMGPVPVHLMPGVQDYWRRQRESGLTATRSTCLVTGKPCEPVENHGLAKNVPGTPTPAPYLSNHKEKLAFHSYGLIGNANAPISREASESCLLSLNRLLSPDPIHPKGHRLPKRNLRLSDDTAALFWNAKGGTDLDWLLELNGENPEGVRALLESPHKGRRAPLQDTSAFYTLLLSGAQGRSIVRNFLPSSTKEVAEGIGRFLDDVAIEKPFGKGIGAFPLGLLLRSLAVLGKSENLPPSLATEVYLAALKGHALPPFVLGAAVRRNRADASKMSDSDARKRAEATNAFAARCSLIRASLIRKNHPQRKELPVSLDPNCQEIGYTLGRLLAVLDRAQALAIPGANATIVDRYFGTASTAPATVFPTLLQKGQQHLGKLRGDKERPWAHVMIDKALTEVTDRMEAKPFPKILDLSSQGLFALGFHHQRQAFFAKKETPASTHD